MKFNKLDFKIGATIYEGTGLWITIAADLLPVKHIHSLIANSCSFNLHQERIMRKRAEGREERETTTQKIKNWKLSHGILWV